MLGVFVREWLGGPGYLIRNEHTGSQGLARRFEIGLEGQLVCCVGSKMAWRGRLGRIDY